MIRRTHYLVAGSTLLVETRDRRATDATDALFDDWYMTPGEASGDACAPALIVRSEGPKTPVPCGLETFAIDGGGTCHVDGTSSYLDIDGSIVTIGLPDRPRAVDVRIDAGLPLESPALRRLVRHSLAAALRLHSRFELPAGGVVDPGTGAGVLIAGPAGSGKSTLTVNLAASGWPFLADDVLLLERESGDVTAWPLRRRFAVAPDTIAASPYLQACAALGDAPLVEGKQAFVPHEVFEAGSRSRSAPAVILFPELTGSATSRAMRLTRGETMARLTAMSPWTCYDRTTAAAHLAVLGALATQAKAWSVRAGRDLLDPMAASDVVAECVHKAYGRATPP